MSNQFKRNTNSNQQDYDSSIHDRKSSNQLIEAHELVPKRSSNFFTPYLHNLDKVNKDQEKADFQLELGQRNIKQEIGKINKNKDQNPIQIQQSKVKERGNQRKKPLQSLFNGQMNPDDKRCGNSIFTGDFSSSEDSSVDVDQSKVNKTNKKLLDFKSQPSNSASKPENEEDDSESVSHATNNDDSKSDPLVSIMMDSNTIQDPNSKIASLLSQKPKEQILNSVCIQPKAHHQSDINDEEHYSAYTPSKSNLIPSPSEESKIFYNHYVERKTSDLARLQKSFRLPENKEGSDQQVQKEPENQQDTQQKVKSTRSRTLPIRLKNRLRHAIGIDLEPIEEEFLSSPDFVSHTGNICDVNKQMQIDDDSQSVFSFYNQQKTFNKPPENQQKPRENNAKSQQMIREDKQNLKYQRWHFRRQSREFWDSRYKETRNWVIMIGLINLLNQISNLIQRKNEMSYRVNIYYMACTGLIFILLALSQLKQINKQDINRMQQDLNLYFFRKIHLKFRKFLKRHNLIYIALSLTIIRNSIRVLDIEQTKGNYQQKGTWTIVVFSQGMAVRHCLEIYYTNFKLRHFLFKLLGLVFLIFGLSILVHDSFNDKCRSDTGNETQEQLVFYVLCFFGAIVLWLYYIKFAYTFNQKYFQAIYYYIQSQAEANYIVNRLEESIIIVSEQEQTNNQNYISSKEISHKIDFVNDLFIEQFQKLLLQFEKTKQQIQNSQQHQIDRNISKIMYYLRQTKTFIKAYIINYFNIFSRSSRPDSFEALQKVEQNQGMTLQKDPVKPEYTKNKMPFSKEQLDEQDFLNVKIFDIYSKFSKHDNSSKSKPNNYAQNCSDSKELQGIDHRDLLLQKQKQKNLQNIEQNEPSPPQLSLNDILKFKQEQIEDSIFFTQDDNMMGSQLLMKFEENSARGIQKSQNSQRDSNTRYVQIKRREMKRNNRTMIILQIMDISDSILYDQIQAKNDLLSLINACVSHELRNPLHSIIAQNINKNCLYKKIRSLMDTIESKDDIDDFDLNVKEPIFEILNELDEGIHIQEASASLMGFIVQDLLDYAQIKAGKFRLNIQPFDFVAAVESVMSIQVQKSKDQGIDFFAVVKNITLQRIDTLTTRDSPTKKFKSSQIKIKEIRDEDQPVHDSIVFCDEQRMKQVLLGLQSNALKFTKKGSVQIHLEIIEVKSQQYLQISVIDTGIGIEKEDQNKLFEFFGFLQDTKQMNTKGIGLGLVIADQIVEKFDGKISFKSVPDVGSNFTFTMKLFNQKEIVNMNTNNQNPAQEAKDELKPNSQVLVYQWKPNIHKQMKDLIPENIKKQHIKNNRTYTQHLAKTIQYIQDLQKDEGDPGAEDHEGMKEQDEEIKYHHVRSNEGIPPSIKYSSQISDHSAQQLKINKVKLSKILIVDDQYFNIQAMKIILMRQLDIDVDIYVENAISGEQALMMIHNDVEKLNGYKRCSYNLILMDCQMPHMDGYETCEQIREYLFYQGLPQPIITAVTGHSEQEFINKAIQSGMNQVLTKPVKTDILANLVSRLGYKVRQQINEDKFE